MSREITLNLSKFHVEPSGQGVEVDLGSSDRGIGVVHVYLDRAQARALARDITNALKELDR